MAHDNDAVEHKIIETSRLSGESSGNHTPLPIVLSGTQLVRKFNHAQPDELRILLAVYRLQDKDVDLVMSINIPLKTSNGAIVSDGQFAAAQEIFSVAARSLRIVDHGLFA